MENPDDGTARHYMENPDDGTERHHMENPDDSSQKRSKKKKQLNRVPQNMEEKNRGTHIWRGVEENAKQCIQMRKQHMLPMNPCVKIIFK